MELLEGVMAFAVVMIILSTIVTGITEAIIRVLATRQRFMAKAVKALVRKELLPRFADRMEEVYGAAVMKGGKVDLDGAADLLMRQLTLNPAESPEGNPDMTTLQSEPNRFWRWLRALGRGVDRLTTHSFVQRLAKTEIADAVIASFGDAVRTGVVEDKVRLINRLIDGSDEADDAKAKARAAAEEAQRLKAEEAEIRMAAARRRQAAAARLSEAYAQAEAMLKTAAVRDAVQLAIREAERVAEDFDATAKLADAAGIARGLVKGTKAEQEVDGLLAVVEDEAGKAMAASVADGETLRNLRRAVDDACDTAIEALQSPEMQAAMTDLARSVGAALGAVVVEAAADAEAALKARLQPFLEDLTRTYERYVAAANELFRANAHKITVLVAVLVCVFANVDARRVFVHLMNNPETRTSLIERAEIAATTNQEAVSRLNDVLQKLEQGEDVGLSEEELKSLTDNSAPLAALTASLKPLIEEDELPIGSAYYPYCGRSAVQTVYEWARFKGRDLGLWLSGDDTPKPEAACKGGRDTGIFSWVAMVAVAGALISLGGPFWYRIFSSLSQLAGALRQFSGGGRRETIDPEAGDQQPASAKAAKEDVATAFLIAHAGKPT